MILTPFIVACSLVMPLLLSVVQAASDDNAIMYGPGSPDDLLSLSIDSFLHNPQGNYTSLAPNTSPDFEPDKSESTSEADEDGRKPDMETSVESLDMDIGTSQSLSLKQLENTLTALNNQALEIVECLGYCRYLPCCDRSILAILSVLLLTCLFVLLGIIPMFDFGYAPIDSIRASFPVNHTL